MKSILIAALILGAFGLSESAIATDQNRPVLDVLVADVNGDLEGFLDRMQRIEGVAKRLGLPATIRMIPATRSAGDFAGVPGDVCGPEKR